MALEFTQQDILRFERAAQTFASAVERLNGHFRLVFAGGATRDLDVPIRELTATVRQIVLAAPQPHLPDRRAAATRESGGPEPLWDLPGMARFLGTSPRAVYKLVQRHGVPYVRVGKKLMFEPSAVRKWLDSRRVDLSNGERR